MLSNFLSFISLSLSLAFLIISLCFSLLIITSFFSCPLLLYKREGPDDSRPHISTCGAQTIGITWDLDRKWNLRGTGSGLLNPNLRLKKILRGSQKC